MLTEIATVERHTEHGVWVSTRTSTTCSSCQQQDNCASGVIAKAYPARRQQLFVATDRLLVSGQKVEIAIESHAVLQSSLLVYGLPILGFFVGVLATSQFAEGWQVLTGVALAVGAGLCARMLEQRRQDRLSVSLVRVLADEHQPVALHCESSS